MRASRTARSRMIWSELPRARGDSAGTGDCAVSIMLRSEEKSWRWRRRGSPVSTPRAGGLARRSRAMSAAGTMRACLPAVGEVDEGEGGLGVGRVGGEAGGEDAVGAVPADVAVQAGVVDDEHVRADGEDVARGLEVDARGRSGAAGSRTTSADCGPGPSGMSRRSAATTTRPQMGGSMSSAVRRGSALSKVAASTNVMRGADAGEPGPDGEEIAWIVELGGGRWASRAPVPGSRRTTASWAGLRVMKEPSTMTGVLEAQGAVGSPGLVLTTGKRRTQRGRPVAASTAAITPTSSER